MGTNERIIMIAMAMLGTMITRFLPFVFFRGQRQAPAFVLFLGRNLPPAIFGMLVVFSLKNISFISGTRGIPELLAIGFIIIIHKWKRQMLLSISAGTIFYMILVQQIF